MAKTKPIPDGYTTVTPHLVVPDVAIAMQFYQRAFGAESRFSMPGPDGKVMHGEIAIGGSAVMLGMEAPHMGSKSPLTLGGSPVTLSLYVEKCDASYDRAIQAGARSIMPPTDMFWGDRYSQVVDPYGHTWAIMTHLEDLTPEQMAAKMKQQFGDKPCG